MLERLLQSLQNATNPFKGFLGEVWTIWKKDAGRAVLLARWSWQKLPEELIQQAEIIQQQAQAAQVSSEINQQVNLQLGAMGIFPGLGGGASFGFGTNPDHAMFILYMGMIRAHGGDPPASSGMVQLAESVFRGQMDPINAMIAASPPLVQQQLVAAVQMLMMTGMLDFLRLHAVILAAFSLPRERIPVLLPDVAR